MNRGPRPQQSGFTILETIIVLTVMSALLVSALALFQQKIPKTQFTKSLNELASYFNDKYSNVATGYYPNTGFSCSVNLPTGVPSLIGGGGGGGENQDCVYIGQAVKFGQPSCSAECDELKSFTVFGSRLTSGGEIVTNLADSKATTHATLGAESYNNGYGLSVTKVKYAGSPPTGIGGVAYTLSFGGAPTLAGAPAGAPQVELRPINNTAIGNGDGVFVSNVDPNNMLTKNPPGGILVCLKSGTTKQYATITLGAGGNASSVDKQIMDEAAWNPVCS